MSWSWVYISLAVGAGMFIAWIIIAAREESIRMSNKN